MSDKRRCIGSKTFGIEAHDAPIEDFPVQPSQKDGLGRMCKPHWTAYTRALRKAATASKAAPAADGTVPAKKARKPRTLVHIGGRARGAPEPIRTLPPRKPRKTEGELIVEAVNVAIDRMAEEAAHAAFDAAQATVE